VRQQQLQQRNVRQQSEQRVVGQHGDVDEQRVDRVDDEQQQYGRCP
jgi:hypothetical protein